MAKSYSGVDYIDSLLSSGGSTPSIVNTWSQDSDIGDPAAISYDWMTQAPANPPVNGNTFEAFTAAQQAGAMAAFALCSERSNLTFTFDNTVSSPT